MALPFRRITEGVQRADRQRFGVADGSDANSTNIALGYANNL
jgi:hypothetical protein